MHVRRTSLCYTNKVKGIFIEGNTRYLAKKHGEIDVIKAPLFMEDDLKRIGEKILIPTKIYKAIYVPSTGEGAAYLTDNASGADYKVISIADKRYAVSDIMGKRYRKYLV